MATILAYPLLSSGSAAILSAFIYSYMYSDSIDEPTPTLTPHSMAILPKNKINTIENKNINDNFIFENIDKESIKNLIKD